MVPVATGELLLASCNLVITLCLALKRQHLHTDKQAEQRRHQSYCESPPLKLAQADDAVGFAMAMHEAPALSLNGSLDVRRWVVEKVAGRRRCWGTWQQAPFGVGRLSSSASACRRFVTRPESLPSSL